MSEETFDISLEQYEEFEKLIDGAYFWSLKMIEGKPSYLDGYGYVLEGFKSKSTRSKQKFHIVAREVPHQGSFRQACDKLMEFYNDSKKNQ